MIDLVRQVELRRAGARGEIVRVDWLPVALARSATWGPWSISARWEAKTRAAVERRVDLPSVNR